MSSSASSLRAMISRISSWERSVTWATVSSSTVVAPRRPLTMSAGGIAGHSTGIASAAPLSGRLRVRARLRGAPGAAAAASDRTSSTVRWRHRPGARSVSRTGPIRVRTRRRTGWPDGLAHAADLAVAALVDDDAQHAGREHADLGGRGGAVVELDALAQRPQGTGCGGPARHLGHVLLGHPVRGVGEQLGERRRRWSG